MIMRLCFLCRHGALNGLDDLHDPFHRHGGAASKFPGLRILTALTMMGAALSENGGPDAGTVHDGIFDDSG